MARPHKDVDRDQLAKLAALGTTISEMADFFNVSADTLERRFAGEIAKGRTNLKIKLRRLQIRSAENGSITMQIYLGKVILGQKEHAVGFEAPDHQIVIADADELEAIIAKRADRERDERLQLPRFCHDGIRPKFGRIDPQRMIASRDSD